MNHFQLRTHLRSLRQNFFPKNGETENRKNNTVRLPEQHFFPASKIRQRSLLCWRSCTDSLPTPGVRKKSTSGASQWINFHNSKTFVNYFRYRTRFLMLENPIQHSPGAQRILLYILNELEIHINIPKRNMKKNVLSIVNAFMDLQYYPPYHSHSDTFLCTLLY